MNSFDEIIRLRTALEHISRGKARDGGPADPAEYALSILEENTRITRESALKDASDAQKWRALKSVARVRVVGSSGLKDPEATCAHIGLELWTHHEASSKPEAIEDLERFVEVALALQNPPLRQAKQTEPLPESHTHVWGLAKSGEGAVCGCGAKAGSWYCPDSFDHLCHYSKNFDSCDFCGQPEERK